MGPKPGTPEYNRMKCREWYWRNKDYECEKKQRYYWANRERILARQKARRAGA